MPKIIIKKKKKENNGAVNNKNNNKNKNKRNNNTRRPTQKTRKVTIRRKTGQTIQTKQTSNTPNFVVDQFVQVFHENDWRNAQIMSIGDNGRHYSVVFTEDSNRESFGEDPIKIPNNPDNIRAIVSEIIVPLSKTRSRSRSRSRSQTRANTIRNASLNSNEIQQIIIPPENWVDVNQKRFPSWINETFIQYQTKGREKMPAPKPGAGFSPYGYQKLLRDFMQSNSPYRGILLYHGLGSGKTCTSITIAENLKSDRNILIVLPATLKANYIEKGLKVCGDRRYKNNNSLIREKYTFISYNASNKLKQFERIGSLDNRVIILEEVHGLISLIVNGGADGRAIYEKLMNAKNTKIIAMSGTPLINYPFEIAILMNILRGYMEVNIFEVKNAESNYQIPVLINSIKENPENQEAKYIPGNRTLTVETRVRSYSLNFNDWVESIKRLAYSNRVELQFLKTNKYSLFPDDIDNNGEEFDRYFIDMGDSRHPEKLKNQEVFRRRLSGLISFYYPVTADYPAHEVKFVELEMSPYQFTQYQIIRQIEKLSERGSSNVGSVRKSADGKKKTNSSFRIFSRQICNFIFPETIDRPYKPKMAQKIRTLLAANNSKKRRPTVQDVEEIMNEENNENEMEDPSKMSKKYLEKIETALSQLRENRESLQGALLEKYSPKMKYMIDRIRETPGLVFIYSQFRALEGVGVATAVLEANGYERYIPGQRQNPSTPKYAIYSGMEDQEERQEVINVYSDPANKHGEHIKILLGTAASAEGLDLKNIRQVHILEPYWNEVKMSQVIGRAVRIKSHIALPPEERNVIIYRYLMKFSNEERALSQEEITTDQFIYDIARRKKGITDEILNMLREMAMDCVLNSKDNGGRIACYSYGQDLEGPSYQTNIREDIIAGYQETNTKEVTKKVVLGGITDKGIVVIPDKDTKQFYRATNTNKIQVINRTTKIKRRVGIDVNQRKIYDIEALKLNNMVQIGTYNDMAEFIPQ
jgi:superfamily II DNA or RNA helicase